jgi:pantoate--beta-alanine ligase
MEIFESITSMRAASRAARQEGKRAGFVPTMGALHEGHLSLVRAARATCDVVAVSIFVNPTQFGPNEDFSRYPRTFEKDQAMLEQEGVDFLFMPSAEEMYPAGATTYVHVEGLGERLCGKSRPGHFRGVATVVAKLFHIVGADVAFFGQKDAAQVAVIRRMVKDLNFAVEIAVGPIVREPDGLAMSSRNIYLNWQERQSALALHRSLVKVQDLFEHGERSSATLIDTAKNLLAGDLEVKLDYFEIVNPETLEAVRDLSHKVLVAVAAFVGNTRLIDNVLLG